MPLEYTSRWPRVVNGRGRYESWAMKLTSSGKPLKQVLAPRMRIRAVLNCSE